MDTSDFFGTERIGKILFKLVPPVILAQLIQTLYSIVDSLFVGRYSDAGLTALSIIYPVQPLMIALAVGTGVGINTGRAAKLGAGRREEADAYAGVGTPLAAALIMRGRGFRPSPPRAVCPKHIAHIFRLGVPNILMQSAYTFYILGLNLILAGFSDQTVTVLGIYYKWQTFFSSHWGLCRPASCRRSASTTRRAIRRSAGGRAGRHPLRHGADGRGHGLLRHDSRADAPGVQPGHPRHRDRARRLPLRRHELPAAGDVAHLPDRGQQPQKLAADGDSHGGALCAPPWAISSPASA